ncbi:Uu.00g003330.m01.CDS01 [Anthostomella pinea]|uniref:Uu.00g003330.m01.CDS01 n=1 Tax=Anthostomella pinea TaxID=933095 RepID=A0AAI8VEE6_9PEZI|nr:Uu.00g003330.m01.CDS01 [Anthostomella pinea]
MLHRILSYSVFQQNNSPLSASSNAQLITGLAYPLTVDRSDLAKEPRFAYLSSGHGTGGNTGDESDGVSDQMVQAIKTFTMMQSSGAVAAALTKAALGLLQAQITKILRLETEMEPGKPLMAYGLDSLSASCADGCNGETAFHHPNSDDPNGTTHHRGGHFIGGDIRDFDHGFFQFTRPQAAATDPQQRLLLELTWEAFESAGMSRESVAGSATGVYTACFSLDYDRLVFRDPMELPVYLSSAVEKVMLSNRPSHAFDLRGPSLTLDTACSGGLTALHLACQSLQDGETDAALATATNLILGPDFTIGLSNLHMSSADGRCYPFDDRGDGYGRGEGVVVLVLKRLADAVRDRDPIRAVIRGTAAGQDGYTPQSITYPNGRAQADLARKTYARAGLRPEDVVYVEAHGTGTKAGDSEELGGIADVGAIGHTESVAGLASMLKATVMLERGLIPPVAGYANPKPGLPLRGMCVPTQVVPWPQTAVPRISINSFGFGGANAHVVLEGAPEPSPRGGDVVHTVSPRLFTLSANSSPSLEAMVTFYHDWVEQREETDTLLADLSYTLLHRRSALPYRTSVVADCRPSLLEALRDRPSLSSRPVTQPEKLDVVFVFTGQGSQWAGMGRELLLLASDTPGISTIFRDSIRASRDMLRKLGATWDLEAELLREATESRLSEAELAQPATSAIQIALLALLGALGVRPRAVVGHSSGEIGAAYAAGYLSHETAIKVAFHRGFMAQAVRAKRLGRGAMLSVGSGEQDVQRHIESLTRGMAGVACVNSPRSVTISGDSDAVDEVIERIAAADDGTFHRKLLVDTAYHSHHMRAIAEDYAARLGVISVENPSNESPVAFTSSVTGEPKASGFDAAYWVANLVFPVRFADAVQAAARNRHQPDQHTVYVEIGPHPSLAGAVRQNLQHPDVPKLTFDYHGPLQRKVGAVASALALAGRLFERGISINWQVVSSLTPGTDTAMVRHDLPAYPWDHSVKHWHESRAARAYHFREEPYHDLVGVLVPDATDIEPRWRHFLSLGTLPWLADHVVDGLAVFPGAGYVCMAIEAIAQLARQRFPARALETFALSDVSFKRGLVVPDLPSQRVETQLSLKPVPGGLSDLGFQFAVTALTDSGQWYEHATGVIDGILAASAEDISASPKPRKESLPELPPGSETIHKEALYADLETLGNAYGPTFAGLDSISIAPDASVASASFDVPDVQVSMPYQHQRAHIIHPSTLDIILHTVLPLVSRRLGPGSVMPVHIDELLVAAKPSLQEPNGQRVLSVSGMEVRSLAVHRSSAESPGGRAVCYELNWKPDMDYLRAADLPEKASLLDVFGTIASKRHGLTTIGLGCGVDLTAELLDTIESHDHAVVSHDFVDATPSRFDDAAGRFQNRGFALQLRTLRPQYSTDDAAARGFESSKYDVVLAVSPRWLAQASVLVKAEGHIVLVLGARDSKAATEVPETPVMLQQQLRFHDEARDRTVVVAKPAAAAARMPARVHILTHSDPTQHAKAAWASAIQNRLRGQNITASIHALGTSTVEALRNGRGVDSIDDVVLVVDDQADLPILSDARTFAPAAALLGLPQARVLLSTKFPGSRAEPTPRHGELRLVTVHASAGPLADMTAGPSRSRLIDVVVDAKLNSAVATSDDGSGPETEPRLFADDRRPVILSPGSSGLFVDYEVRATPLGSQDIEVQVRAMALPNAGSRMAGNGHLGEYVGVVAEVGAGVKSLVPGDSVVALAPVVGASVLRITAAHAGILPSQLPPTVVAALLLDAMAASYVLQSIPSSEQSTILVHGTLSAAGRAVVALARLRGFRVTTTAADSTEAQMLDEQLSIGEADVLISRRSLHRRLPSDLFVHGVDAIIHADSGSENGIPNEALGLIKPFGKLIVLGRSLHVPAAAKNLALNVAIHLVDIEGLLLAQPDLKPTLIAAAVATLEHIPLSGLESAVHNVAEATEMLRLINTGVHAKAALQADPDSTVDVVKKATGSSWDDENATYVVSGGLGDLGQRLLLKMARRGAKHLAILSRRVINRHTHDELQAKLEAFRPGLHLYTLQCDVSSEQSVQAAADGLKRQGAPSVRAVIQSAVVWNDRLLEMMTHEEFTGATKGKVAGTLALLRVFSSPHLCFFLSLSSTAGILGAGGLASYNAGNVTQGALAHITKSSPTRILSVDIGWIEDAVQTKDSSARKQGLRQAGATALRGDELARFFEYVLSVALDPGFDAFRQLVIGFDVESLAGATALNGNTRSALFNQVRHATRRQATKEKGADAADKAQGPTFDQVVADGDLAAVASFIATSMAVQLARLISVEPGTIDPRQGSIMALGLDSLVAVELRNWAMRQFDAPLQSSEILANQTVHALAEKVALRSKKVSLAVAATA